INFYQSFQMIKEQVIMKNKKRPEKSCLITSCFSYYNNIIKQTENQGQTGHKQAATTASARKFHKISGL
ncbi:MAG: hypothetical protein ACLFS7_09475, partial [Desulfosudaceae bacterium]